MTQNRSGRDGRQSPFDNISPNDLRALIATAPFRPTPMADAMRREAERVMTEWQEKYERYVEELMHP